MTTFKHTPGPLYHIGKPITHEAHPNCGMYAIVENRGPVNADTYAGYATTKELADLFAAAPELFEALQLVANCVTDAQGGLTIGEYERGVITAAIAKAEGKP